MQTYTFTQALLLNENQVSFSPSLARVCLRLKKIKINNIAPFLKADFLLITNMDMKIGSICSNIKRPQKNCPKRPFLGL